MKFIRFKKYAKVQTGDLEIHVIMLNRKINVTGTLDDGKGKRVAKKSEFLYVTPDALSLIKICKNTSTIQYTGARIDVSRGANHNANKIWITHKPFDVLSQEFLAGMEAEGQEVKKKGIGHLFKTII